MPSQPKIVVGLCCLGQYRKKTVEALLELTHDPLIQGWCTLESALLPMARNRIIQAAYAKTPDFTHFLAIDDDMADFTAQHVKRLLSDDVDIVSALVTFRKPPYIWVADFIAGNDIQDLIKYHQEESLQEVRQLGMAFTLIKREVLDKLEEQIVEDLPGGDSGSIWFTTDRSERSRFNQEVDKFIEQKKNEFTNNPWDHDSVIRDAVLMGQYSHLGTQLIGEDIAFCRKAKEAGFKLHVDCGCPVGHIGDQVFDYRMPLMMAAEEEKCQIQNN